ncbi:hypothetical protein ON010_g6430 [Phytophthora cinnamomi]|nr:hypothetical protein ON010_g6430 [Phytophthora cinnamomi]
MPRAQTAIFKSSETPPKTETATASRATMVLTRSRSKAENQPVFVDDKWNDAYIQTKDEQIDAMLAADATQRGWDELGENADAKLRSADSSIACAALTLFDTATADGGVSGF